jgi:hypothetical protein
VLSWLAGSQQILDSEELALPNDGQYALMRVSPGESGQLVAGFERYANTGGPAERDQSFQAVVATLPRNADMIKLPGTGTDGLLDRVETVQNFHCSSLLSKWKYGRETLRMFLEPKSIPVCPSPTFFRVNIYIFYGSFNQKASLLRTKERL